MKGSVDHVKMKTDADGFMNLAFDLFTAKHFNVQIILNYSVSKLEVNGVSFIMQ